MVTTQTHKKVSNLLIETLKRITLIIIVTVVHNAINEILFYSKY